MTPTRYRECLEFLGLSLRGLAPILQCSDRLTRSWAAGREIIPPEVADWLDAWVVIRLAHLPFATTRMIGREEIVATLVTQLSRRRDRSCTGIANGSRRPKPVLRPHSALGPRDPGSRCRKPIRS